MAQTYGPPKIITDGLVFAADAGNPRCYTSGSTTGTGLINNSPLTLTTDVTYSSLGGGSWDFTGADPSITTPSFDAINFDADSDFSICFWVRMDNESGYDAHVAKSDSGAGYIPNLQISGADTILRLYLDGTYAITFYSSKTYPTIWRNLVWVKTAAGVVTIYEDGISVATTTGVTGKPTASAGQLSIGNDQFSSELDGKMTAVTMYNKALTQAEITQNYNSQKSRFGL